jgi:branched-chain amino acid transport system substrate-binding protein
MNRKKMWSKILVLVFTAALTAGFSAPAGAAEIKVGALNDMTGATSDVGKDYALGIAEGIHYVNDTGGINGKPIKLYQFDYGYRIPEALTKYNLFKRLQCAAILGWGTGDTEEALAPTVAKDKIPYVSASYSGHLTNPEKTPYNLFFPPIIRPRRADLLRPGLTRNGRSMRISASANRESPWLYVCFALQQFIHKSRQGPCRPARV